MGSPHPWARGRRRAGFTLVELLLVVVIIGILAALVIPRIAGRAEEARKEAARANIARLVTALQQFEMHVGRYPTTEEGLAGLMAPPPSVPSERWKGPYLEVRELPRDPWDADFVYRYNQGDPTFVLFSKGPDGLEGTEDDIERP